jgi:hypothetical protein
MEINSNRKVIYSNYFVAPPSFEESVFGTTSIRDADDSEHVLRTIGHNPQHATYTLLSTVSGTPPVGWATPKA